MSLRTYRVPGVRRRLTAGDVAVLAAAASAPIRRTVEARGYDGFRCRGERLKVNAVRDAERLGLLERGQVDGDPLALTLSTHGEQALRSVRKQMDVDW